MDTNLSQNTTIATTAAIATWNVVASKTHYFTAFLTSSVTVITNSCPLDWQEAAISATSSTRTIEEVAAASREDSIITTTSASTFTFAFAFASTFRYSDAVGGH